jgi:hypothetical protein
MDVRIEYLIQNESYCKFYMVIVGHLLSDSRLESSIHFFLKATHFVPLHIISGFYLFNFTLNIGIKKSQIWLFV